MSETRNNSKINDTQKQANATKEEYQKEYRGDTTDRIDTRGKPKKDKN